MNDMEKDNKGAGDKLLERLKATSAKGRIEEFVQKDVYGQIEELKNSLKYYQHEIIELSFEREDKESRIEMLLSSSFLGEYGDLDNYKSKEYGDLDKYAQEGRKKIKSKTLRKNYQLDLFPKENLKEIISALETINSKINIYRLAVQSIEEEIKMRKEIISSQGLPEKKPSKEKGYTPSILFDKLPPVMKKAKKPPKRKKIKASEITLKICILGEKDVGILSWFMMYNQFFQPGRVLKTWMLSGIGFGAKRIKLEDKTFKHQIWFLNPNRRSIEELKKTTSIPFILGCNGAFLVYDITKPDSLSRMPEWINLIREKCGNIPIFLLGNNCEMEELIDLTKKQANDLVNQFKLSGIYEISIGNQINLDLPFQKISEFYFDMYFKEPLSAVEM